MRFSVDIKLGSETMKSSRQLADVLRRIADSLVEHDCVKMLADDNDLFGGTVQTIQSDSGDNVGEWRLVGAILPRIEFDSVIGDGDDSPLEG
jgi:hypothetical protein